MSVQSLDAIHLRMTSAADLYDVFRRLGYPVDDPYAYEGDDLDAFELPDAERANIRRAYIVARLDGHTVYLYEVADMRQMRLRALAWAVLERGTGLIAVTRDYDEVIFVDPRMAAGKVGKSHVRVNKLKVITKDPTRHDADTLNAIHARGRDGAQVYDAQAP